MPARHRESTRSAAEDLLPPLFRTNSYALTGLFLAPGKDRRTLARLRTAMAAAAIDWGRVLGQANRHFCTPLLFSRLERDDLLAAAPTDLRDYLQCLHAANGERNADFRQALQELLQLAQALAVPCLLLKGAAAFCDDLYGDPAARMLGDLDVLVDPADAGRLWQALIERAGYTASAEPATDCSRFAADFQPHHLPRLLKRGTPVAVEIHFRPSRGHAGRILPPDFFRSNRVDIEWNGLPAAVPNPKCRLLHAALHALLPRREFILSNLSLAALAEFSLLRRHYSEPLEPLLAAGDGLGFGRELRAFAHLATWLATAAEPEADRRTRSDAARILAAGRDGDGEARWGERVAVRTFYLRHRFAWIWRNACHAEGFWRLPQRLHYLGNWTWAIACQKWGMRQAARQVWR